MEFLAFAAILFVAVMIGHSSYFTIKATEKTN